jgi:hypothetical protein
LLAGAPRPHDGDAVGLDDVAACRAHLLLQPSRNRDASNAVSDLTAPGLPWLGPRADATQAMPQTNAFARGVPERRVVRVLDADPDLARGLSATEVAEASVAAIATTLSIPAGSWRPPAPGPRVGRHLGLLILSGLMTRTVAVGGVESPEIVGEGDLLRPWDDSGGELASVPFDVEWAALSPVTFAVLDPGFVRTVCRWPALVSAIVARTVQRTHWVSVHMALAHLNRVDARLLVLFWHLADRWGRVCPDGVEVPIGLSHSQLAKLVGAQRPSVTMALKGLAADRRVVRRPHGGWLLSREPPELRDLLTKRGALALRARDDG